MRRFIGFIITVALFLGCSAHDSDGPLDQTQLQKLKQYILTHQMSPAEYVVNQFSERDIVFLGEFHRIKDNPLLVQELIPLLHENGIYFLATEFATKDDQPLIDSLMHVEVYDEKLVRHINMNQYSLWPWQEYIDIFKVAWELNHSLPDTATKFRILGINCNVDWSHIKTRDDLNNPEMRRKVWAGCGEVDWADVIMEHANQGKKLLVYCGSHHAFTRYRQPIVDGNGQFIRFGDVRVGNHVYDAIGERCMTIFMHSPWYHIESRYRNADQRPIGGAVDRVMEALGDRFEPVGFDVVGNPFGGLTDSLTIYSVGYENFTLSDFCDGYIYFCPFAGFEMVTFAEGFYNEGNIELARRKVPQPYYRNAQPEDFEENMRKQLEREQARYRGL